MLGYGFTFMDSNNTLLSTNDRFFLLVKMPTKTKPKIRLCRNFIDIMQLEIL